MSNGPHTPHTHRKGKFDEKVGIHSIIIDDREPYDQLKKMMVHFDLGFELMPGTGRKDLTPAQKPFEQESPGRTDGG